MRAGTLALKSGCFVVFTAGIIWNTGMSISDRLAARNQPQDIRKAIRLMPLHPDYRIQLANELFISEPDAAQRALESAIRLDPFKASAWIKLGLLYEEKADLSGAEHALLNAAKVDKTYLPAWSLANFYFRHDRTHEFWQWARTAAAMEPGDAQPLFRLAWYVEPDVDAIESHLQLRRSYMRVQFLNFLMSQQETDAVGKASLHLLASDAGKNDTLPTLISACEWLLQYRRPDLALPLWNSLAEQHLVPYPPISSGKENRITNAAFSRQPSSNGFDWHIGNAPGVSAFFNTSPNALGFEFSGDEKEPVLLMYQVVPVTPGKAYKLTVDYSTSGISSGSGVAWVVSSFSSGAEIARTDSLSAEQGGEVSACFVAPEDVKFINLLLEYQRQPGTVLVEGKITLYKTSLMATVNDACGTQKVAQ